MGDDSVSVDRDIAVLFNRLSIANVINGDCCIRLLRAVNKTGQRFTEQVVACDNQQIAFSQLLPGYDEINITNRAELVVVAFGAVVDDLKFEFGLLVSVALSPGLEVMREFVVRHNVNRLQVRNIGKVLHDPLYDRFASDREQRLRFVER